MKELVATILAVILAVFVIFLLNNETNRTKELETANNEIEIKTSAFQQEKRALEMELDALRANRIQKQAGIGSLLIVFTEIDESFSQDVLPLMSNYGLPATLCITENTLPVILNSSHGVDLDGLINDGWQTALYWDGTDDFNTWYTFITGKLSESGISIPKLLCIDYSSYVPSVDNTATVLGFTDMIINFNNSDISFENLSSKLNIINGHSWYTTASSSALASLNFINSQLAFFVGTHGDELAFEPVQFAAMLETAMTKQTNEKIVITTPDGSRKQIEINEEEYRKAIEGYDEKITELEDRILELDTKINSIYAEHYDNK